MRNRWSLFSSGFVVFSAWYLIAYIVTTGTFTGVVTGFAFGLSAIVGGLIFGAAIGVSAHAIDLHSVHRSVRAGDARGGARVSLGKLPSIVPVVRKGDDAGDQAPTEPTTDPVSESLPQTNPDLVPEHNNSDVADTAGIPLPEPAADAQDGPVPDRLAIECARFVAEHDAVAVTRGEGGDAGVGTIDRAANSAAFGEFMATVSALAADGVDVSRVAVSMGLDGVPAVVTFPVASNDEGASQ